jgi:hypothetical protein
MRRMASIQTRIAKKIVTKVNVCGTFLGIREKNFEGADGSGEVALKLRTKARRERIAAKVSKSRGVKSRGGPAGESGHC